MQLTDKYESWVYENSVDELRDLYRQDLQLNRHKLERASAEQATLFEKWYAALEDVEADIKDAQGVLKRLRAKVNLQIRNLHSDLKEGGIAAKVEINEKVAAKSREILALERYQGRLKGAVEAARQRKSMIQILKDLYVSNYWDKAPTDGKPRKRYGG